MENDNFNPTGLDIKVEPLQVGYPFVKDSRSRLKWEVMRYSPGSEGFDCEGPSRNDILAQGTVFMFIPGARTRAQKRAEAARDRIVNK